MKLYEKPELTRFEESSWDEQGQGCASGVSCPHTFGCSSSFQGIGV